MRAEKQPDKCVNRRERRDSDVIMGAVQQKIYRGDIPCSAITVHGRPMYSKLRERVMRREFGNISLRMAYLLADAVGVDIELKAAA